MEFAIKIGDKYLVEVNSLKSAGGVTGHTSFVKSAENIKLILEDKPQYFSNFTTKSRVVDVIELMRWEDIEPVKIEVIPNKE